MRHHKGLTLFEWFVVIVCVGICLALLIPAISIQHRPRRNVECAVQVKNLALAAIQHENALGHFPGFVNDFGTWDAKSEASRSLTLDSIESTPTHRKIGTWAVALMPWLDAQPTYEHWTDDSYPILFNGDDRTQGKGGDGFSPFAAPSISNMQCPEDPFDDGQHGRNSYACNAGLYHRGPHGKTPFEMTLPDGTIKTVDFAASMNVEYGVFNNQFAGLGADGVPVAIGPKVTMADFRDGKTYTILFSENLQAMPWHRAGFIDASDLVLVDSSEIPFHETARYTQGLLWHHDDDRNGLSTIKPVHRINGTPDGIDLFVLEMTKSNAADLARPSSAHVEGVNASFADGGNRFISDSIDYQVYRALLTPNGSEKLRDDALLGP